MKSINELNKQCILYHFQLTDNDSVQTKLDYMPDLESIQIAIELDSIKNNSHTSKMMFQPLLGHKVNLYSCITESHNDQIHLFV